MPNIETDYLVVGAGAAGMAFTDSLIADSDADIVMVDRRHRPGGHWNDAYPFVRLHQPSAFYGVNSRVLGSDSIDDVGDNAGFYERATAAEILDYYGKVLEETLLPSGRVRFFGMSEYAFDKTSGHHFVSRLTGELTTVNVRRKVVDATYFETSVPSTHTPSFTVDSDARFIAVNGLVHIDAASGYTVVGAGKTAMDTCCWLLDNGVDPDAIRWIRPRDAWIQDRRFSQPLERVSSVVEGTSLNLEAAAQAESVDDLFKRLESSGALMRIDTRVDPTMFRCAILSQEELEKLRRIENVIRLGRVQHLGVDQIVLDQGSVATDGRHVHVDCSAIGLRDAPGRPVFEEDRITLQQVRFCQPTFNAAFLAYIEASRADNAEKNLLSPPNPLPTAARDWMANILNSQQAQTRWDAEPDIGQWMARSRLDIARGLSDRFGDPDLQPALMRYLTNAEPALVNLEKLMA